LICFDSWIENGIGVDVRFDRFHGASTNGLQKSFAFECALLIHMPTMIQKVTKGEEESKKIVIKRGERKRKRGGKKRSA